MTYSTLGIDGELLEQPDPRTSKKKYIFIPTVDATGKEVLVPLPQASRRQGLYIIGATGTGKSGLITNLVLQDIKQGKGVAVLDPHTDLTHSILAQLPATHVVNGVKRNTEDDVILLDALDSTHVFGLNLYQCDDPTNDEVVQETYERVAHIFDVLWLDENEEKFGPRVKQGIRNSTLTLIGNSSMYGCGMLEIPMLFEEDEPRAHLLAQLPPQIKQIVEKYWKRHEGFDKGEKADRADMVANKVEDYTTNPIFRRIVGQSRTTIDFSEAMNNGKIVLVKLPGKFEKMTEILGAMIIAQILAASYAREKQQKRRQFNIYADEFQRFATRDFAKLLTETSRKYNTPVTIAHQARDFLDLRNQAASMQVANLIVLRVQYKDAQEVAGSFKITPQAARLEVLKEEWHDRIEDDVEDGEEAIRTPVLEPIQYMASHGVYPLEHTRTFIETYGKQLVELAQKEEDDERARLNEERRYEHDLIAGVRYIAPPLIQVTYHYRSLLQLFNKLFYDAMKAGKTPELLEKTLDDMLKSRLLILVDTFIQAFRGDKKGYREALAEYPTHVDPYYAGGKKNAGLLDVLIMDSGEISVFGDSIRNIAERKQCFTDGILDTLIEGIAQTNSRWWQMVEEHGVEQTLTGDVSYLTRGPNFKAKSIIIPSLHDTPNLTARRFELQNQLAELPAALLQKETLLRNRERNAKQRLHEAYRKYLVAQVRAARASMLFIEKNWQYIAGTRTEDGTPRIYFPELFSKEELHSLQLQAQHYNRDALIIFQDEEGTDHSVKPTTYDDLRKSWGVAGQAFFFNTWEETVSHYFQLFSDCWFQINPYTFFEKRNWQKTQHEVYWRRRYKGSRWVYETNYRTFPGKKQWIHETNVVKEDKKRLWLQTWELKPGIETTWFNPALIEAEIDRGIRAIEAYPTGGGNPPFYGGYGFLEKLLFIETSAFDPAYGHFRSVIIDNAQQLALEWEEAKKRTQMVPEKAAIEAQKRRIEEELALLERIEAEKIVYDAFVAEFREQMRQIIGELAIAPVEQESGLHQPRPRKQIHYLPHARETLTHPQRPYQDVLNEVASQLANLPNYIARIRITNDAEELVEHIIKTLPPGQGLDENGLAKRIAQIKRNMIALGYYRAKTDVDEEIRKRHEQLRQAQGLPVTRPQQQHPRYARQVSVAGHCPHCNRNNPRDAQFCKHCGTKLT